jgi:hypothetical protein
LVLSFSLAKMESRLRHRVIDAVEIAGHVRRGRPRRERGIEPS